MDEGLLNEFGYTLGLIAGEGSFFITFVKDDRYRHGLWCGPKFSISMGAYAEEMLQRQRDRYDLGTLNEGHKGYTWVLSSREDCHALVDYIERYLARTDAPEFTRTPKFDAYRKWCEGLEILQPGVRLSKSDVLDLAEIRDEINYVAASTRYTADEIRTIVEEAHGE